MVEAWFLSVWNPTRNALAFFFRASFGRASVISVRLPRYLPRQFRVTSVDREAVAKRTRRHRTSCPDDVRGRSSRVRQTLAGESKGTHPLIKIRYSLSSGPNISPSLYMGTSHISFFYAGYGRRE